MAALLYLMFGASLLAPEAEAVALSSSYEASFMTFGNNTTVAQVGLHSGSNIYRATLWPLLAITLVLAWFTRPRLSEGEPLPEGFLAHAFTFLSIWYAAITADWLQGPYVYDLYSGYGFDHGQIAQLFVVGFGSSMLFGTFVGSIADKYGRKRCAVAYCVFYIVSCATKHFNQYWVLMFGRVTGGIATSLLFSTFECWLVAEHCKRRGFSQALLRYMFGLMYFGMYVAAIVSGIVSQALVDVSPLRPLPGDKSGLLFVGGETVAFDMSGVLLLVLITPICLMWEENYGEGTGDGRFGEILQGVCRLVCQPNVALLGIVVAGFESSMYVFVFNWTPALVSPTMDTPHGLVFSLFMMACTCGSAAFSLTNPRVWPAYVLLPTLSVAAISMAIASVCLRNGQMQVAIFYMFLIFEFCVGCYYPAVGLLKSDVVPEAYRAGVYNAFRVPLNALVCLVLLLDVPVARSFVACFGLLVVASCSLCVIARWPKAYGDGVKQAEEVKATRSARC